MNRANVRAGIGVAAFGVGVLILGFFVLNLVLCPSGYDYIEYEGIPYRCYNPDAAVGEWFAPPVTFTGLGLLLLAIGAIVTLTGSTVAAFARLAD